MSKSLNDQLKDTVAQTKTLAEKAQQEKRDFTDEENTQILELKKKADELKEKIKKADEAQAAFKALAGPTEERKASSPVEPGTKTVAKTYGEAYTCSKAYQTAKAAHPNATPVRFEIDNLKIKSDPAPLTSDGSSPRMRGAPFSRRTWIIRRRIIPADAGSTSWCRATWTACADHPRGCGEHG